MTRIRIVLCCLGALLLLAGCYSDGNKSDSSAPRDTSTAPVSGDGALTFKVLHTRDLLPEKAQDVLEDAHGGFAVDRRTGQEETYFALSGAGILQISAELDSVRLLDTPDALKNANMHNTTIWYGHNDSAYLTFPSNDANRIFTTTLDGDLAHVLSAPSSEHQFDVESVNNYFADGGKLVPTDVEKVNDLLYVTTGYSDLDYVLTGKITSTAEGPDQLSVQWNELAFGGKGKQPGQFGTGHGITHKGDHLHVSDRPHAEVDEFTLEGEYLSTLNLPEGSYPCDIDFGETYSVVASLHGPDRSKGAPIYILRGRDVVSTVMIKEDLGLEKFQHIHNAVLREIDDRLYIIAQSWNPGDFVILGQVNRS